MLVRSFKRLLPNRACAILAILLLASVSAANDLPVLHAEDAVRIGLERNHALQLVRDQTGLAILNRQTGAGAFFPTANASASHSGELDADTDPRTSVGVSANLQLFNGLQSTFAYRRLRAQEDAAGLAERAAVESTVETILFAYYDIARQKRQLDAIREALELSGERVRLAQARESVGAGSRLERLQAEADLNADSSAFLSQELALGEAKIRLNGLLARDPGTGFDVPDTIPVAAGLPVEAWRTGLGETSAPVLQARARRRAAEAGLHEARGTRLPTVNAGIGYSVLPEAVNTGPTAGTDGVNYNISVSLPLFDGLRARQNVGSARIETRRQEISLRQSELDVRAAFDEAAARHAAGIRLIVLEERNLEVTRMQAEAALERYRVGASSPLEIRDAQQRLLAAQGRLASTRLSTKQSELALRRLAGALAAPADTKD